MTTNTAFAMDLVGRRAAPARAAVAGPRRSPARSASSTRSTIGRCLLSLPRGVWMILDVAVVCGGTYLGDQLFVWWTSTHSMLAEYHVLLANVVLGSSVVLAGSVFGLYEKATLWSKSRIVVRCLLTVVLAMLGTWLVMHLFMYSPLSRRAAACGTLFFLLTASAIRLICHRAVLDVRRGLLVIGQGPLTGMIVRSVRRGSIPGYRLLGIVTLESAAPQAKQNGDIPVAGDISQIAELCRRQDVADVVVAETAARDIRYQRAALAALRLGCRVTDETTFYESTYGEVPVSHITPNWFLVADLKGHRQEHAVLKRVFDVIVAAGALVVSLPICALAALLTWLESGAPVIYSQRREGQGGRPFILYKFRTMRRGAESNGSAWAVPNDPRATRVGRILRQARIDELPQLWNVIRGDMSLVGPRPERPEFVKPLATLIPFYEERHLVKPGLTGWAQINYPYGSTIADARRKLQLDLYYIKHTSIELDLVILLRTLGTFFVGSR